MADFPRTGFSRRDLLKFFGIGAGTLLVPPIVTKAATTLVFGDFENWLQSTSKAIQEKKLVSFQITIDKKFLCVKGKVDDFISKRLSEKKPEKWKYTETDNYDAVFRIETKILPDRFAETIRTKHGRMNFVKMCTDGTLNSMKDVGTYLSICQEASTKDKEKNFLCESYTDKKTGVTMWKPIRQLKPM